MQNSDFSKILNLPFATSGLSIKGTVKLCYLRVQIICLFGYFFCDKRLQSDNLYINPLNASVALI